MSATKRDGTRAAAKRRAAARRRTREIGRYVFVYAVIALLVLGTISTVIISTVGVGSSASPTATPTIGQATFDSLVTQADADVAKGDYTSAIGLYEAYLGQNPGNAEVHYKLGKAFLSTTPPDYVQGVGELKQALGLNPSGSFAAEAQGLVSKYEPLASQTATASAAITATGTLTSSGGITATVPVTNTGTPKP